MSTRVAKCRLAAGTGAPYQRRVRGNAGVVSDGDAGAASVLFALRHDICLRVLNELVEAQYLRRDASGAYLRDGTLP